MVKALTRASPPPPPTLSILRTVKKLRSTNKILGEGWASQAASYLPRYTEGQAWVLLLHQCCLQLPAERLKDATLGTAVIEWGRGSRYQSRGFELEAGGSAFLSDLADGWRPLETDNPPATGRHLSCVFLNVLLFVHGPGLSPVGRRHTASLATSLGIRSLSIRL